MKKLNRKKYLLLIFRRLYGIVSMYYFGLGLLYPFLENYGDFIGRSRGDRLGSAADPLYISLPCHTPLLAASTSSYFPMMLSIRHIGIVGRDLGIPVETPLGPCN